MRIVGICLNRMCRSWSIDCVLISSVFWSSCTLNRRLIHHFFCHQLTGGSGYPPTPMLMTRILSAGLFIEMRASAIA